MQDDWKPELMQQRHVLVVMQKWQMVSEFSVIRSKSAFMIGKRSLPDRVIGARPGQQIVIYARSGPWWVQPWPDRPFIPIRSDSTWNTDTHLGFEYAALLVDQDYHPPPTMDVAPTQGGPVVLVRVVKGLGEPQFAPTRPRTSRRFVIVVTFGCEASHIPFWETEPKVCTLGVRYLL